MEHDIERLANQLALSEFFFNMDSEFHEIEKVHDDTFSYNATGVQVQNTWELPIVVQWPNSLIRFKFNTEPGDIHFGIAFVPALEEGQTKDDMKVEMIEEVQLVPSSTSNVEGEFTLNFEGVIILMWDNNYDWTAIKKLSYIVEVFEPSFQTIDRERTETSKAILSEVTRELNVLQQRYATTEDFVQSCNNDIPALQQQVTATQAALEAKLIEFRELEKELKQLHSTVGSNREKFSGLGIRCLNEYLLSKVFEYLDLNGGINGVSIYWNKLALDLRRGLVIANSFAEDYEVTTDRAARKELVEALKRSSLKMDSHSHQIPAIPIYTDIDMPTDNGPLSPLSPTQDPVSAFTEARRPAPRVQFSEPSEATLKANLYRVDCDPRLVNMILIIHSNATKLKILEQEKKKVKRAIKIWNNNFEREYNRQPSNFERKEFAGQLYEDYQKVSLTLRVRRDKLDDMLRKVQLTWDEFEDIRRNPDSTWAGYNIVSPNSNNR